MAERAKWPDLSPGQRDANLCYPMAQQRLKSSFIYLANSVNDLRSNWRVLTIVLMPLVLASALCLVPNAINIQNRIVSTFQPGTKSVMYRADQLVQEPYAPETTDQPRPDKYPPWVIETLYLLSVVILEAAILATLCMLTRMNTGQREPTEFAEASAILKRGAELAPAFFWVSFLKLLPIFSLWLVTKLLGGLVIMNPTAGLAVVMYLTYTAMMIGAGVAYLWLYFSQFALIFGGRHSFHALLFSRDLMRKRFFTVSTRIAVFLIVWWGYNSFAVAARVLASILLGPIGLAVTGSIWLVIFIFNVFGLAIAFATFAFFAAAGLRLYQDLVPEEAELGATAPLNGGNIATQPAPAV